MNITRAYRVELDPTKVQRSAMVRNAGTARWAYNWGRQRKEEVWWMNQLPGPRLKFPTAVDLQRELNERKKREFAWMYASSKCAPQQALRDLDRAYANFFEGRARFPKFRSRHRRIGSFRLTGAITIHERHIDLPRIGRLRLKERGYLPVGPHVLSVTVSERRGRWYASAVVEEERPVPAPIEGEVVGVDLGIRHLVTISDGTVIENRKAFAHQLRKLQHLQRAVSRKEKGSQNREKAKRRLSRCHAKIADLRKDTLHKATTALARTKSVIVVESLRPRNLLRNLRLARSLADASFGEFVRQLEYKCRWYGSRLARADAYYPSTKLCSACGTLKEMPLSEKIYSCPSCGLVIDRDLNAARNLARVAASSAETENACGGRRSMSARTGAFLGIRNPASTAPGTVV